MIDFLGSNPSEAILADISQHNLGGVILYWYQNMPERSQILSMTTYLNDNAQIPLFIATDQEPGFPQNLNAQNGFSDTPSAHELGVMDTESETRNIAATFANWFTEVGINLDLAPVVDLRLDSTNVIGDRAFSSDPATVTRNAYWFIDEFHQQSHATTLKHFPGHGSAADDTHAGFTDVTDTWSDIELEPYRALIDSGVVDLIMTAHVFNSNIDSLYPATLSYNTITGLLRDSLGYNGVVITDEMSMGAIRNNYGIDEAFILAVNAGVDIILYRIGRDPAGRTSISYIIDLLEQKVIDGTIPVSRINESYARIIKLKENYFGPGVVSTQVAQWINPVKFELINYPNPFNPATTIEFTLPRREPVRIVVYDLLGRSVRQLTSATLEPGRQSISWDGRDDHGRQVATGMYIYRLLVPPTEGVTPSTSLARKMMLLK
ncbi:MAG: T9SS type A sorting domain-containing protein [Candidatus Marinimicrobia bacterium]|nr:T9SS type A sorting domain-containing protein [Candidatus Neomarinimicrobiota bacterium]